MKEKEKNVPLLLTLSSKKCACCGEVKPTTEFSRHHSNGKKWGFYSQCKECKNKKEKKYRQENPDKRKITYRKVDLKRKYGMTIEDKKIMLKKQDYKCAVCGEELFLFGDFKDRNKVAHVDHNHETGKVRGLLCNDCNRGIGLLKDNPEYLLKAASYLNKNI